MTFEEGEAEGHICECPIGLLNTEQLRRRGKAFSSTHPPRIFQAPALNHTGRGK